MKELRSGLKRYKRLRRLGCLKVGARVVLNDIVLRVAYGAAFNALIRADRKTLAQIMGHVGAKMPLEVARHQIDAVCQAGLTADFVYIARLSSSGHARRAY